MRFSLKVFIPMLLALAVAILVVAVGAKRWPRAVDSNASGSQKRDDPVVDALPPVVSLIRGIDVIHTGIDAERQANITVVNNTGREIVGVSLCSGNLTFSDDNGVSQESPRPLVPAGGSYTFQQPLTNLKAHEPIRICAAFYGDNSEEGDSTVRENIHNERERQKQKRLGKAEER